MRLQNTTLVILQRTRQGGQRVAHVVANPEVPGKAGQPVLGPMARRLMTVKEVAKRDGLSLNKAAELRRAQPLLCLADFAGQTPVAGLVRSPDKAA